jgi:hypothetical protein
MSKKRDMQRIIRAWKDETKATAIDMDKVALHAAGKGWPLPTPKSALEILSKQFADAAREQTERDPKTGRPYRLYHAYPQKVGEQTHFFWYDIHEATRPVMHKSAVNRREQMVSDGVQLTLDLSYWNSINPDKEKIDLPMDLGPDIQWRLNTPDDTEDGSEGEAA